MSYGIKSLEEQPDGDAEELPQGTMITLQKQYKVLERLGEGGMGKVYKAFDPIMNRHLALKVMKTDVPDSEKRRFRLEARLCGRFSHPNLVRVLDVGTTREHGLFWFGMEYIEGKDISGAIGGGRAVPLHVAIEIFSQILAALRYVHRYGVVHRDIKPANIYVSRDPVDHDLRLAKLLDFGVAKDLSDPNPEDAKIILGDPAYIAPEQCKPNGPLDGRADLYALGMTFFESVTGHHPWEHLFEEHPRELIRAHKKKPPPAPSGFMAPETSPALATAIDAFFAKACAKLPDERFADAPAMQAALLDLARHC